MLLVASTSIWLTVAFTVERYIAVCHPMRGRLLCTEQRARRAVILVWVFCVAATSSVPWEHNVILHQDEYGRECIVIGSRYCQAAGVHSERLDLC